MPFPPVGNSNKRLFSQVDAPDTHPRKREKLEDKNVAGMSPHPASPSPEDRKRSPAPHERATQKQLIASLSGLSYMPPGFMQYVKPNGHLPSPHDKMLRRLMNPPAYYDFSMKGDREAQIAAETDINRRRQFILPSHLKKFVNNKATIAEWRKEVEIQIHQLDQFLMDGVNIPFTGTADPKNLVAVRNVAFLPFLSVILNERALAKMGMSRSFFPCHQNA